MEKHQQRNNSVKRRPIWQRAEYFTAHKVHGVLEPATSRVRATAASCRSRCSSKAMIWQPVVSARCVAARLCPNRSQGPATAGRYQSPAPVKLWRLDTMMIAKGFRSSSVMATAPTKRSAVPCRLGLFEPPHVLHEGPLSEQYRELAHPPGGGPACARGFDYSVDHRPVAEAGEYGLMLSDGKSNSTMK